MINLTKEQIADMMLFTQLKDEKDLTAVVKVKDLMQHYKDDSVTVDIEAVTEIPKDYVYDTETDEFFCYRNKYTGNEIHIVKEPNTYRLVRPTGQWIVYGRQGGIPITAMCSNCNYEMKWYKNKYKYCPNCGADMGKGEE